MRYVPLFHGQGAMAKVIITRPRSNPLECASRFNRVRRYVVLIEGPRVTSIGDGEQSDLLDSPSLADLLSCYDVLINGQRVALIGYGETIELELPTGRHRVRVRSSDIGSPSVDVNAGPNETRQLAVGPSVRRQKLLHRLFTVVGILYLVPIIGYTCWLSSRGVQAAIIAADSGWYTNSARKIEALPEPGNRARRVLGDYPEVPAGFARSRRRP
jgi:hypothetical protein